MFIILEYYALKCQILMLAYICQFWHRLPAYCSCEYNARQCTHHAII